MTHDSNPAERERINVPALVTRLERHAFAIERDMSASTLWSDLILCRDLLKALIKQQALSTPSVGGAEGWKLVPVEPTEAMLNAACEVGPDTNNGQFGWGDGDGVYRAMLAAAPPALVVDWDHVPEVGNMISQGLDQPGSGSQPDPAVGATAALALYDHGDLFDRLMTMYADPEVNRLTYDAAKEIARLDAIIAAPTPPASTTLSTGMEITEEMVERARRYLRHGNLESGEAIEMALQSIFDPPTAALSPPAGGKEALVEAALAYVKASQALDADYRREGARAVEHQPFEAAEQKAREALYKAAALAPASDEVA